ncbi:MAG: M56 family metallopeptidase [Acidobacteriota bacterium]|nr:M56 family metallopeptidase [Acidobacteriota bacterium]
MTQFLAEWALRSSILIVCGALLMRALRVKDPSLRLAAWTAILCGSLAIPALTAVLPKLPIAVMRVATVRVEAPVMVHDDAPPPVRPVPRPDARMDRPSPSVSPETIAVPAAPNPNAQVERSNPSVSPGSEAAPATPNPNVQMERPSPSVSPSVEAAPAAPNSNIPVERSSAGISKRFDWARAAVMLYVLVALVLLLRLGFGLAISLRLLRRSRVTGQATEGIEIRESDRIASPVTLGILRPAIVLPGDWRQWTRAQMDAVLAHERSHVQRHDPAVQLLSAIHRVLLWPTPLSWFLHRQIVRVAEELSDDAAVEATRDRTLYAEILLDFIRRGVWRANWQGVPVARYGGIEKRIHRILDGTALSLRVTRWGLAAILILGLPIAYVAATAGPQTPPPAQTTARVSAVESAGTPSGFGAPPVTSVVAGSQGKIIGMVMPKAAPAQPAEIPSPAVAPAPDGATLSGPAFNGGVFVTPVPDAPFSAEAEQDMEQVLNDGSAFHRKSTAHIARDSQGRIYNEGREVLPASSTREPILLSIHIYDPETRLNTFLDPYTHIARQRILPNPPATEPPGNWWLAEASARTMTPNLQVQDLGPDVMDGLDVHGYRRIYTISADASGTNRPVIVSDEIWYSEQLHINVLKRHSDPRTGQLTVTVTNINVNEPDVELFAIPPDYKFVDMTPPVVESAASVRVAPN